MIIRTIDEFKNLQNKLEQSSKYYPVALALILPKIVKKLHLKLDNDESCKDAVVSINNELENHENFVVGFCKEKISDKERKSFHQCHVDYSSNMVTYAEDNSHIKGKPSIGIQFIDADDGCNDWIWVATDVLLTADPIETREYLQYKLRKGFRIIKRTNRSGTTYEVQKKNIFGVWKTAIFTHLVIETRMVFSTFNDALNAYYHKFDNEDIIDVLTV